MKFSLTNIISLIIHIIFYSKMRKKTKIKKFITQSMKNKNKIFIILLNKTIFRNNEHKTND